MKTLETYRWVASRWPAQHRRHRVPYYIHKTLASLRDDEERWERITKPPLDRRTQTHRWTDTAAKQAVDQKFADTTSVQQKVERTPALPRMERSRDLIELVGACSVFVATVGRVLPTLRGHAFTAEEKAVVARNLGRVRATADWLEAAVTSGDVSLDEGLARLRMLHPQLTLIWGDSAYAGTLVEWARRFLHLTMKIVTKRPGQTGFKVLARRWIVERSLSWLMNARRNVIDFERKPSHSEAHLTVASITLMTRRLTRKRPPAWTRKPASAPQAA
ncbi:DUF6192 family protein [Nonomuraea sp. NPDC050643]|uniref:DUF6192 family protein n=1 Tax=Nonomuraea sp. NPDC050643 TaxID=3155660 RepID=UPI0033C83778